MYGSAGGPALNVYQSETAGKSEATLAVWYVDDIDQIVDQLPQDAGAGVRQPRRRVRARREGHHAACRRWAYRLVPRSLRQHVRDRSRRLERRARGSDWIGTAARMAAVRRYVGTVYDSNRWDGFELRPGDIVISFAAEVRDDVDADDLRAAHPAGTVAPAPAGHAFAVDRHGDPGPQGGVRGPAGPDTSPVPQDPHAARRDTQRSEGHLHLRGA